MLNNYTLIERVVEEVAKLNIPMVIKGNIVIRSALNASGIDCSDIGRSLLEIDWIGTDVTNKELEYMLGIAIRNISYDYKVEQSKEFEDFFYVKDARKGNKETVFLAISMSMRKTITTSIYTTNIGKVKFNGSSLTEILYDKVELVSNCMRHLFTNTLYTLYKMSYLKTYCYMPKHRDYSEFKQLLNYKDTIEEDYMKLKNIDDKPDFNELYIRVLEFLQPFIIDSTLRLFWDGNSWLTPEKISMKQCKTRNKMIDFLHLK